MSRKNKVESRPVGVPRTSSDELIPIRHAPLTRLRCGPDGAVSVIGANRA
ncbi:hypothetical protein [Marivita sp.]|nr:hypothetical protein [Marivita sp.]